MEKNGSSKRTVTLKWAFFVVAVMIVGFNFLMALLLDPESPTYAQSMIALFAATGILLGVMVSLMNLNIATIALEEAMAIQRQEKRPIVEIFAEFNLNSAEFGSMVVVISAINLGTRAAMNIEIDPRTVIPPEEFSLFGSAGKEIRKKIHLLPPEKQATIAVVRGEWAKELAKKKIFLEFGLAYNDSSGQTYPLEKEDTTIRIDLNAIGLEAMPESQVTKSY